MDGLAKHCRSCTCFPLSSGDTSLLSCSFDVDKSRQACGVVGDCNHSFLGLKDMITDSHQNQSSPCDINALSMKEVMRIKDMITDDRFPAKSQ